MQVALRRPVLLTLLPRDAARRPQHHYHFERQVALASHVRHENVISAIDAGTHRGCRYVVTEHVQGRVLAEVMKRGRALPLPQAVTIARDVARALACLDASGLAHHDVSPETILVTDEGVTKLSGFAVTEDGDAAERAKRLGRDAVDALYAAPETALGERTIDVRADLYSLGCVLYEMATGHVPFFSPAPVVVLESHATRPPTDPREIAPSLPAPLVEVMDRCLRKRREHRYAKAADLANDLEAVRAGREIAWMSAEGALWPKPPGGLLPRMRRGR